MLPSSQVATLPGLKAQSVLTSDGSEQDIPAGTSPLRYNRVKPPTVGSPEPSESDLLSSLLLLLFGGKLTRFRRITVHRVGRDVHLLHADVLSARQSAHLGPHEAG